MQRIAGYGSFRNSMFRDIRWACLRAYPEFASGEVEGQGLLFCDGIGAQSRPTQRPSPSLITCLERWLSCFQTSISTWVATRSRAQIGRANPQVQDFMKANGLKTIGELESYFFDRVRKGVVAHGKIVIGWEEVAGSVIPDDVLVQSMAQFERHCQGHGPG